MIELIIQSDPEKKLIDIANVCNAIRALRHEGKRAFKIVIKRLVKGRSVEQNALYWVSRVQPFGDFLRIAKGPHWTDEMAHEVLKEMFLKVSEMLPSGKVVSYVRSTTDLTTAEFSEYLEKIDAMLAVECGFDADEPRKRGHAA